MWLHFFSTLEKEKSVWSVTCAVENMSKSVTFTSSTYHLLDFSMAVYCGYKKLTVWAFFPSFIQLTILFMAELWFYYLVYTFLQNLLFKYRNTHLYFLFSFLLCGCFNNLCTFQRYLPGIYMVFFLVSSQSVVICLFFFLPPTIVYICGRVRNAKDISESPL